MLDKEDIEEKIRTYKGGRFPFVVGTIEYLVEMEHYYLFIFIEFCFNREQH